MRLCFPLLLLLVACDPGQPDGVVPAPPWAEAAPGQTASNTHPPELRRLQRDEVANTFQALLGVDLGHALPDEGPQSLGEPSMAMTPIVLLQYMDAAEEAASGVNIGALMGCDPETAGCLESFVLGFGRLAFRRPLEPAELTRYKGAYDHARTALGHSSSGAAQHVLAALLSSPNTLYVIERGGSLADYELATRLAFMLWAAPPDQPLLDAAQAGALSTPDGLSKVIAGMLADPRAEAGRLRFLERWLDVDVRIDKSPERFPGVDALTVVAARGELERRASQLDSWDDLMVAEWNLANPELVDVLGGHARRGILSQPVWLMRHAHQDETSPVRRGKWLRERLLCQTVPSPPGELVITPIAFDPEASVRERLAQHSTDDSCAGCHALLDPLGLAFESWDGAGAWREIDSTGALTGTDVDGPVAGPNELLSRFGQSATARACFVRQVVRYGLRRRETAAEEGAISELVSAFEVEPTLTRLLEALGKSTLMAGP